MIPHKSPDNDWNNIENDNNDADCVEIDLGYDEINSGDKQFDMKGMKINHQ